MKFSCPQLFSNDFWVTNLRNSRIFSAHFAFCPTILYGLHIDAFLTIYLFLLMIRLGRHESRAADASLRHVLF